MQPSPQSRLLYLLPVPLGEDKFAVHDLQLAGTRQLLQQAQALVVENLRTARRFVKAVWPEADIDAFEWYVLDKHKNTYQNPETGQNWSGCQKAISVLMSEAGCPAIGDPGEGIVATAHQKNIRVVPMPGPSSFLQALMASGLNGQQFSFAGYLPLNDAPAQETIKKCLAHLNATRASQIVMDTPYRNNRALKLLLKSLPQQIWLCIAKDINGSQEWIKTQRVADWQKTQVELDKVPCVFVFGHTLQELQQKHR